MGKRRRRLSSQEDDDDAAMEANGRDVGGYRRGPVRETPSAVCTCCNHSRCAALKGAGWCDHWFFVRWVAIGMVMPDEVLQELRARLEPDRPGYCMTWTFSEETETTVCYVLLKLRSAEGFGPASDLLSGPTEGGGGKLDMDRSDVWNLPCCWFALGLRPVAWLTKMRDVEMSGGVVLDNAQVRKELENEIRLARVNGEV